MQITEFTNQMVTLIKSKVSTEMKNVQSHTIWKNNGIQEEGITLIEKGVNISPTVYMREYYDRFLQGETLRALAEEVIEELERCKTYKSMDIISCITTTINYIFRKSDLTKTIPFYKIGITFHTFTAS